MRRILVRFALSFITVFSARSEELTDLEEGMGGGDSVLPVREAQPVVSRAETLDETSSPACCCIPSGVFRPFTSMRDRSNIHHSQRNVGDETGQGLIQPEAHICAYSLPIAVIIGLTDTTPITVNLLTLSSQHHLRPRIRTKSRRTTHDRRFRWQF